MVWAIHSTDRSVTVNQSVRKAITLLRATAEHQDGASVSVGVHGDAGALVGVVNAHGLSLRFDSAARAGAVERMRVLVGDLEAAL
jgi:glutamate synthase domain-containing protein 3